MEKYLSLLCFLFLALPLLSQTGRISGRIHSQGKGLELATVQLEGRAIGATTDADGRFILEPVPYGTYHLLVSFIGYEPLKRVVTIDQTHTTLELQLELTPSQLAFDQVVITGTRTFKRQTSSAVIVNVLGSETLNGVQACNLAEGLKFQPGLRVETDCQTCNYTQLRMNGLGGGYSQILINGRPIFSPLTGLYGMEQIPANMIERIEVVRGGGSALYGSSAIGGTVNVITKIPKKSGFDIGYTQQQINGRVGDGMLAGNATLVNEAGNAGLSLFVNNRRREYYDHNGDGFSELPQLRNQAFGANLFFLPSEQQKLEISLSSLNEYRYGGEMVEGPAHLAQQSEERNHQVFLGSVDYQLNFNEGNSSLIAYAAGQITDRSHYTGIFPDEEEAIRRHLQQPPYGSSDNSTFQGGLQVNHRFSRFWGGSQVLTLGSEYIVDDVLDRIDAYRFVVDQLTRNLGIFLQSDWEISPAFSLLSGLRLDQHNLVDRPVFSPRLSLLYRLKENTQFRLTYGAGFRAPQAFDSDLHIAFAGGGVSRVSLDPELEEERSRSLSASVNYDYVSERWIAGFTLEGFYTKLNRAFVLDPIGEDEFGERFVKRNGEGSTVQGLTLELRANVDQKAQLEAGFTLQSSLFDSPVENIDGLEPLREFLRTPNDYGYATLTLFPAGRWNTTLNLVYTGRMQLAHFAGAPEQDVDEYVRSSPFTEISVKTGYTVGLKRLKTGLEFFGGIKNLTNAYQSDFDSGKNRDSNYIYGPALPRTVFVGLKLRSME